MPWRGGSFRRPPSLPAWRPQVQRLGSDRLRRTLQALAAGESNDPDAPVLAAADLNDLFRQREFYSPRAFAGVDANCELDRLLAAGPSRLDAGDQERMIHYLERADLLSLASRDPNALDPTAGEPAEPLDVPLGLPAAWSCRRPRAGEGGGRRGRDRRHQPHRPLHLPQAQQPVPRAHRRPSCSTASSGGRRHTARPLHPDGSDVLAVTDILEWEALFRTILQQANAPGPSAGRQLWDGLDDGLRKRDPGRAPAGRLAGRVQERGRRGDQPGPPRRVSTTPTPGRASTWQPFASACAGTRRAKRTMGLAEVFRDMGGDAGVSAT